MFEERRRFKRFDIPLNVEYVMSGNAGHPVAGKTINFSRTGLCLETNEKITDTSRVTELKIKHPQKDVSIPVVCDVVWQKQHDNRYLLGVKLMAMDKEAKTEILDYAYDLWLKKMRG